MLLAKRFSHACGQRGVSLLEVLIAMVVVFITLLSFAGLSIVAHSGMTSGRNMTRAVTLAQEKIEDIRREGIPTDLNLPLTVVEPYGSMAEALHHQRTLTITPNTPLAGLHSVSVTLHWDQGTHATSLTTYFLN